MHEDHSAVRSVGLSAKFSALKAGGRPLVILCVATLILLVVQNVVGILVAASVGAHPFYGLWIGSVSFVGGLDASARSCVSIRHG